MWLISNTKYFYTLYPHFSLLILKLVRKKKITELSYIHDQIHALPLIPPVSHIPAPICYLSRYFTYPQSGPWCLKCCMTGDVYIQRDTYTHRHPKTYPRIYIYLPSQDILFYKFGCFTWTYVCKYVTSSRFLNWWTNPSHDALGF